MTDRATLAKARRELEELYLGVPDDSVNLTFQDFAQVSQNLPLPPPPGKKKSARSAGPVKKMDSISESTPKHDHLPPPYLAKIPSLDFSRGLESSSATPQHHHHRHHQQNHHVVVDPPVVGLPAGSSYRQHHQVEAVQHVYNHDDHGYYGDVSHGHGHHVMKSHEHGHHAMKSPRHGHGHDHVMKSPRHEHHDMKSHGHGHHGHVVENSVAYDDMSVMSGMSITSMYQEKSGRRRPGIPHSNICAVCSVYIYIFRNRCLVSSQTRSLQMRRCCRFFS